jgi:hypothetical protein
MECNPSGNLKVTRLVSRMNTSHGAGMDFLTVVIGLKACGRDGYLRIGTELHGVVVRLYFSFAPVPSNWKTVHTGVLETLLDDIFSG